MKQLLCLFALAGCPAAPRYVVADVTANHRPVEDALVAASCGSNQNAALRTDEDGHARLRVYSDRCSLVVAKPGFPTVETGPTNVCPTPTACAAMRVDLSLPVYAPQPMWRAE
jgi:hypothetical protein